MLEQSISSWGSISCLYFFDKKHLTQDRFCGRSAKVINFYYIIIMKKNEEILTDAEQIELVKASDVNALVAYAERRGLCPKAQIAVAKDFDFLAANRVFAAIARRGYICQPATKKLYGW